MADKFAHSVTRRPVQHKDLRAGDEGAKRRALLDIGDEKIPAACGVKGRGDRRKT